VWLPERGGFAEVPVYDRYMLARGAELAGPAIVEERESTLVVGEAPSIRVDDLLNLVVTMPSAASERGGQ
jgi:N-methylhydantoinase A